MKVKEFTITETGQEMNFTTDKFSVRTVDACGFKSFEMMKKVKGGWLCISNTHKEYAKYFRFFWNYQVDNEPEVLFLNAEKIWEINGQQYRNFYQEGKFIFNLL